MFVAFSGPGIDLTYVNPNLVREVRVEPSGAGAELWSVLIVYDNEHAFVVGRYPPETAQARAAQVAGQLSLGDPMFVPAPRSGATPPHAFPAAAPGR